MDLTQLWKTVLAELEVSISKPVFRAFFIPTTLISLENAVATIGCNNVVAIQMVEGRYYSLIKQILDTRTKQNNSLIFKVASHVSSTKPQDPGPLFTQLLQPAFQQTARISHLRADFTFTTFAVSTTNHMAYAAATAVATTPGTLYNPLFFYGGVGVGKTHLMQAIGNEILSRRPETKIIYCMGEEFTNEIIDAIQTKTTKRFKDKYRTAQVLLIDDVQFIAGKNAVQEEFFHTFNTIQREGGQIVLTSDKPPHEIDKIEERLRSRFEGGLLIDVQNPDFELRCAILRIKAQQKGIDLDIKIAQILAANVDSVRKLEGLLTRLLSESSLKKIPISEELASAIVGKVGTPQETISQPQKQITPKQITEAVVRRYGVTLGQLRGTKRSRPIARPRQMLMYLLRIELQLPFEEVGVLVGGRDHTTVMHAVETITHLLSTNDLLRTDLTWIKKEISGQ